MDSLLSNANIRLNHWSLTEDGKEYWQQQKWMSGKHRHSCHTDGQRQQQTPEGTLHTYMHTRQKYILIIYMLPHIKEKKQHISL